MKLSPFTCESVHTSLARVLLASGMLWASLGTADAAAVSKANNTTALNQGGSWVGGIVPGANDIALWDTNVTAANSLSLGGDQSWAGVAIGAYGAYTTNFYNPLGSVTITNPGANTLTLGAAGIDLSLSTNYNLTLTNNALSLYGNQTWNLFNGRTVTMNASIGGTGNLLKLGNGTLTLTGTNTFIGALIGGGGLVNLNFSAAMAPTNNILNPAQPLVFDFNGATVAINGKPGTTNTQTFNGIQLKSGVGVISSVPGSGGGSNYVDVGVISRPLGGSALNFGPLSAAALIHTASTPDPTGLLGPWAGVASAGFNTDNDYATNWAAVDANGMIYNYTNWTTLSGAGPTMANGASSNVRVTSGSTGNVTVGAGTTTVNTIIVNDSTARTIDVPAGSTLRLGAVGGIMRGKGAGNLTLGASAATPGTLTAGGADNTPGELIINSQNGGGNKGSSASTLNSTIADNGSGAVTVSIIGGEELDINSTNTFTGGAYLRAGRVQLKNSGARLGTGPIYVSGAPLASFIQYGIGQQAGNYMLGATLYLAGGNYTNDLYLYGSGGVDTAGGVLRNPGSIYGKITLQGDTVLPNGNYWGNIMGAGNLYWRPGGTCNLYGTNNNYAGDTIIMNTTLAAHNQGNVSGAPSCLPPTTVVVVGQGSGIGTLYGNNANAVLKLWGNQLIAGLADGTFMSPTNYRAVDLGAGNNITLTLSNNTRNLYYSGGLSNSVGTLNLVKDGSYTQTLAGSNGFSGTVQLLNGMLILGNPAALGSGAVTLAGNGVLNFGALTAMSFGGLSGTNTLGLTNASGAPVALAFGGNDFLTYTYSGVLTGGGSLAKNGNDSEYLDAANTYTGATTINAGTLGLTANGSLPWSSPIVVGSGATFDVTAAGLTLNGAAAQVLGGSGSINGAVTAVSGSTLNPGAPIGTLSFPANLSLTGGVTNVFDLSSDPTGVSNPNDLISVSGILSLSGLNLVKINPYLLVLGQGEYPLIQYGMLGSGGLANLQLLPVAGYSMYLTNDTSVYPNLIAVVIAPAHNPASIVWRGNGTNNNWDLQTTADWYNNGLVKFYNGDSVTFDDSGSNNTPVNLVSPVGPAALEVNITKNYTFAGSGKIGGATGLTKDGSGALTLLTANDYVGGTTINAGTIHAGNGGALGSIGSGNIVDNGALILDQSGALALTNSLSGAGSLTLQGGGTFSVTGDASGFGGPVTIGPATVTTPDFANLGNSGSLTMNGGVLQISATLAETPTWNITLGAGGGTINHLNALTLGDGYNFPITGTGSFTKAGPGSMTLQTSNAYSGLTVVAGGTLQVDVGGTTAWIPNGLVLNGGSVVYNRSDSYTQNGYVSGNSLYSSIGISTFQQAGNTNAFTFAPGANTFNNVTNASPATLVLAAAAGSTNTLYGSLNSVGPLEVAGGLWNIFTPFMPGSPQLTFDGGTVVVLNPLGLAMRNFNVPSMTINSGGLILGAGERFSNGADNQSFTLNGGLFAVTNTTYGIRFANNNGGGNQANLAGYYSWTGTQTGGDVYAPGSGEQRFSIGGYGPPNPGAAATYTMTGGRIIITNAGPNGGSIFLGADTARLATTTFALGGTGQLLIYSLAGAQAGAAQVFNWFGGTNTVFSLDASRLESTNAPGAAGTIYNNGGALAPGGLGSAGRTTITGGYNITAPSALLDIDVGGYAAATNFFGATNASDFVQVTGAAVLEGNLRVHLLNGFESFAPANPGIVILSAASVAGTFANLDRDGRIVVEGDPARSFHVAITATNVVLDGYQTPTLQAFFTNNPAAGAAPLAVTFSDLSGGGSITNRAWNFGDGSPVLNTIATTVSHAYSNAGAFSVSLSISGPTGVAVFTATNAVTVAAPSVPSRIGGASLVGGNFVLTVGGGTPGAGFRVLTSTNLSLPAISWTPVVTNQFAADGTFTNSIRVLPGVTQNFYRISVP